MNKITYYLYYSENEPYGINACLDGENGKTPCAFMYFTTKRFGEYRHFGDDWAFPGGGASMAYIVAWAAGRDDAVNKPGEFITACKVRRLFKQHGIDLPVVPGARK